MLISPVMLLTAIAIKCYDGGLVLYRQVRLIKDGRQFSIMKFRGMRMDADKDGVDRIATSDDVRITAVGKWIRLMRIDELLQRFNVLSGQKSFVGPRPERPEIAEQYLQELLAFSLRLEVKAGLSGYARFYGHYSSESRDKLKLDRMYIDRMCLVEDVKLIFVTVRVMELA